MIDNNIIIARVGRVEELYRAVDRAISTFLLRGFKKKYFFELLIGKGWEGLDEVVDKFLEEKQVYIRPKFMRAIKRDQIIVIARSDEE